MSLIILIYESHYNVCMSLGMLYSSKQYVVFVILCQSALAT